MSLTGACQYRGLVLYFDYVCHIVKGTLKRLEKERSKNPTDDQNNYYGQDAEQSDSSGPILPIMMIANRSLELMKGSRSPQN